MTPHRQSDSPPRQTLYDTVSPPPPPQALQEKAESLQRRLHGSEKRLFSKELEGEEKVTQPVLGDAAPSETLFLVAAAPLLSSAVAFSNLQTSKTDLYLNCLLNAGQALVCSKCPPYLEQRPA